MNKSITIHKELTKEEFNAFDFTTDEIFDYLKEEGLIYCNIYNLNEEMAKWVDSSLGESHDRYFLKLIYQNNESSIYARDEEKGIDIDIIINGDGRNQIKKWLHKNKE